MAMSNPSKSSARDCAFTNKEATKSGCRTTALAAGLAAGTSYLNLQTTAFPGGEVRGFLTATATGRAPEPGAAALFAIALGR
jgi:hypothetical protein